MASSAIWVKCRFRALETVNLGESSCFTGPPWVAFLGLPFKTQAYPSTNDRAKFGARCWPEAMANRTGVHSNHGYHGTLVSDGIRTWDPGAGKVIRIFLPTFEFEIVNSNGASVLIDA